MHRLYQVNFVLALQIIKQTETNSPISILGVKDVVSCCGPLELQASTSNWKRLVVKCFQYEDSKPLDYTIQIEQTLTS